MNNKISMVQVNIEFIKLARSLLTAWKQDKYSQKDQRRAESLKQLFEAKLITIERDLERAQHLNEPIDEIPLFDLKKVN